MSLEAINNAVIEGDEDLVVEEVKKAIDAKVDPLSIINDGLIGGMNVVGVRFKANEMYVPEVLMCAAALKAGVEVVKPLLAGGAAQTKGTVLIGTVTGDLHDIGKNLVAMMIECSGYTVIDLGIDVTIDQFIDAIAANKPQVVALSCMLTTTMLQNKNIIDAFVAKGVRKDIKVIIGGAPITHKFAEEVGADGFAGDAAGAVDLIAKLLA